MTEDQLRDLVKSCGWSLLRRRRYHQWYAYAARFVRNKRQERYLGRLADLEHLTEDQVKRKLQCA
jgi:hypothetical protein